MESGRMNVNHKLSFEAKSVAREGEVGGILDLHYPPLAAGEVSAALLAPESQAGRSNDFRILLQKADSLEYLQNDGTWKYDRDNAFTFESAAKAADYAEVGNFKGVQISYSFGNPDQDLAFPLN